MTSALEVGKIGSNKLKFDHFSRALILATPKV